MMATTERYECVELDWDTAYFGVTSAKVALKEKICLPDLRKITEKLCNYEFVTITNLNNNSTNNYLLGQYTNAFLVDLNIQFEKRLVLPQCKVDTQAFIENNMPANEKIKLIAAKSFVYSRFYNDPFLSKEKAYKLYENWVSNSFGNEKKFFVYSKSNDDIAGFILFSFAPDTSGTVIELIAVNDAYAGQGVGKKMVAFLEFYLFKAGCKYIKVGTQVDNLIAQYFYSACGFKHKQCNSVYHLWNK